jgi:hypothetical protein
MMRVLRRGARLSRFHNGALRDQPTRFKDLTSYTANAIIENENFGGAHNLPDTYTFDSPPPK